MQKEQQICDEEMVEGWPVCSGWLREMIDDMGHYMHGSLVQGGKGSTAGSTTISYIEICRHSDSVDYLSENLWTSLVRMFGVMSPDGEVCFDPFAYFVESKMVSKGDVDLRWQSEDRAILLSNVIHYVAGINRLVIQPSRPHSLRSWTDELSMWGIVDGA